MRLKVKSLPIIMTLSIIILVSIVIILINTYIKSFPNYENIVNNSSWMIAHLVHIPQFLIPFLIICFITKGKLSEYGYNMNQKPPAFTHIRMFILGVSFGLLLSLKYLPQIINKTSIDIPQPVTLLNVIGNMTFQWIVVGLSEETMFRGLIQTYLMNNLKGFVTILGHDLHIGTVIGAIFWGAFHFINILVMPLASVVFVVILTTIAGLAMGYAYQETRSLLTTIIVHNTIFGIPLTLGYIIHWIS